MNIRGGFEHSLAYDGFMQESEEVFEYCLCIVVGVISRRVHGSVRHLVRPYLAHMYLPDRFASPSQPQAHLFDRGDAQSPLFL